MKQLHILTDTSIQNRFTHLQLANFAKNANVTVLQYRNKNYNSTVHYEELKLIAKTLENSNTNLIINDLVDLAIELNCGTHVGQEDMKPEKALKILDGNIIGVTVHNLQEYEIIQDLNIDYIGVGPVFGTNSKNTNLKDLGLIKLNEICKISKFPVIAIGNIQLENLESVIGAGAAGVAVLSAFCKAENPEYEALKFMNLLLKL